MLTTDCVKLIIDTLRGLKYQHGDDVYIDSALDLLIKEGGYRVVQEKNIKVFGGSLGQLSIGCLAV